MTEDEHTERSPVVDAVEKLTDNFVAIAMTCAAIYFVAVGIEIPEWFAVGFGLVLKFYFDMVQK